MKSKINEYELVDIWRELNPNDRTYSWRKYRDNKQARLDYFLISSSLVPYVQKVDILPGIYSDHSVILMDIDFSRFVRGRGFWKLNTSLLKQKEYIEIVKGTIRRVACQYAEIENDPSFYFNSDAESLKKFLEEQTPESLQSLKLNLNPQLFLEVLLLEIRRETIRISSLRFLSLLLLQKCNRKKGKKSEGNRNFGKANSSIS